MRSRKRSALAAAALAVLVPLAGSAAAHPIEARLSASGIEFLQDQVSSYVPAQIVPPEITKDFACASFTQRDTVVGLSLEQFDLSLPEAGVLRVDLTMSLSGDGEAFIDNPYACFGSATCGDHLSIQHARAVIDFSAWIDEAGKPRVRLANVNLDVAPDDLDFHFTDCALGSLANLIIDFTKDWALGMLLEKVEEIAENDLAPKLEEMLAGFTSYQGAVGPGKFSARLTSVDIQRTGIGLGADVDVTSDYPAASCLPSDPGDPAALPGGAPDLDQGVRSHLGAAVNFGLIDDVLYHVWREGFLCITPEVLGAFGIDLDFAKIADMIPGLPEGTTMTMRAVVKSPPRVEGLDSDHAELVLKVAGVAIELTAHFPDGQDKELNLELDATITAELMLDPDTNALAVDLGNVSIDRMVVMEELGLEESGMDFARLRQMIEERILPHMLQDFARMPVTGPIFGGLAGYYLIVRELRTTTAWVAAKADLFRAPANDRGAPETTITAAPDRPIRPQDAVVRVSGDDAEVPAELLKFRVTADGEAREPTYVKAFKVGEVGKTATVHVAVAAIDLAGNEDGSPAEADITVDGILPRLTLLDYPFGTIDTTAPQVRWTADDDLSPADRIGATIEIWHMLDGQGASLDGTQLVDTLEVDPGDTEVKLGLDPGRGYRVIVTVHDEAGNKAADAFLFAVSADAAGPGGCGCRVAGRDGGAGGGAAAVGLLALGLALARARRRRAA